MRFLPGKGFVYRLAMDATRQGDDVVGWKSGACSGISSRHSIKGSSEPFASSARGGSGFCLSFIRSISEHQCFKNKNFSPLMSINCLVKCLINFWTFLAFRVQKQINGFLMNQFMNINVSKKAGQKGGSSRSNRRGVQPSRLNFSCFQLSPGVARCYSRYSLPG